MTVRIEEEAVHSTRTPPARASTPPILTKPTDDIIDRRREEDGETTEKDPTDTTAEQEQEQPSRAPRDTLVIPPADGAFTSPPRHGTVSTPSTPVPDLQLLNGQPVPRIQSTSTPARSNVSSAMSDHATPVTSNAFVDDGLVLPPGGRRGGSSSGRGPPGPRPGPALPSGGRSMLSRRPREAGNSPIEDVLGSPRGGLTGLDILSSPRGGSPALASPAGLPGPSPRRDSSGSGELLLGEMLGLPNVDLSDSEDEDCNYGGVPDIFKAKSTLAPIELRPDRTFLSFQGRKGYEDAAAPRDDGDGPPPADGDPQAGGQRFESPSQPRAYEPDLRNRHGAASLACPRDLSAIFKGAGPRTPATADESSGDEDTPASNAAVGLEGDYPIDGRIPSIRLANRVHQSAAHSNGGFPRHDSYASFTDGSYTTLDDDESYYSFLNDDLDGSLRSASSSSGDLSNIRRRESLGDLLKRANSAGVAAKVEDIVAVPPSSTLEVNEGAISPAMRDLSVSRQSSGSKESFPSLGRRSRTFDPVVDGGSNGFEISGGPLGTAGAVPPAPPVPGPIAQVRAPSSSDDGELGASYSRRRQRRSRRRRKDEARAVEWLDGLRGVAGAGAGGGIAEAASSRFMTGQPAGAAGGAAAASGGGVAPAAGAGVPLDRALGLPHALCRSSTIEAGTLVGRLGAAS